MYIDISCAKKKEWPILSNWDLYNILKIKRVVLYHFDSRTTHKPAFYFHYWFTGRGGIKVLRMTDFKKKYTSVQVSDVVSYIIAVQRSMAFMIETLEHSNRPCYTFKSDTLSRFFFKLALSINSSREGVLPYSDILFWLRQVVITKCHVLCRDVIPVQWPPFFVFFLLPVRTEPTNSGIFNPRALNCKQFTVCI